MELLLYILPGLSVSATLLSAVYFPRWWVKAWDVLHPYLLILNAFLLLVLLTFMSGWSLPNIILVSALVIAIGYHIRKIFPYTIFASRDIANTEVSPTISLLSSNVLKDNTNYQALRDTVLRLEPDLLLLIEYTPQWQANSQWLHEHYSHNVECPYENGFGFALFSKHEFVADQLRFLVCEDIPSMHTQITLSGGQKIRMIGVHPTPPVPWAEGTAWDKDQETMSLAELVNEEGTPTIVAGDFNDTSWSIVMQRFKKESGLLDPRIGRGFFNTFHADHPLISYPIDHIFVSNHFQLNDFRRIKIEGTDHFALFATLHLVDEKG